MQTGLAGGQRPCGEREPGRSRRGCPWPRRLDQAEAMVERCHRLYLRTLRELRELRRQGRPPVVVRGARQVNIAGQQVNLAR